jgi:hypothetical protein
MVLLLLYLCNLCEVQSIIAKGRLSRERLCDTAEPNTDHDLARTHLAAIEERLLVHFCSQ